MMETFPNAMPMQGLLGGMLIGLAAAIMLLGLGRIAGVSGQLARATGLSMQGAPRGIAIAFILGLPLGAWLLTRIIPSAPPHFAQSTWLLVAGGVAVGLGTRLGSGCTSGHGVCGLSRLSPRSLAATALFMASGFATATALHFALF